MISELGHLEMIRVKILSGLTVTLDAELFMDGGELDFEDQDNIEENYISDYNIDEKAGNPGLEQ